MAAWVPEPPEIAKSHEDVGAHWRTLESLTLTLRIQGTGEGSCHQSLRGGTGGVNSIESRRVQMPVPLFPALLCYPSFGNNGKADS